ncbi:MAG: cobalamin-independent methionine synthase II family protein [Hyphomicrobiaceae bacterium]
MPEVDHTRAIRSSGRILTTHAGSLPRPPDLVELYARREQGHAIDLAALAEKIASATRAAVARQHDVGIDIANNGEQAREAFFLYVRSRMSGFGGSAARKPWGDLLAYPDFAKASGLSFASKTMVSNRNPATAIGDVRHIAPEANLAEIMDFKAALSELGLEFTDTFMTAPSPGMITLAMQNCFYDNEEAYLAAVADALRVEYEAAVNHGMILQIDAPDLAMERHMTFHDEPIDNFLAYIRKVVDRINVVLANIPKERVRMHVCWGNYEGPHDCDVPLRDILPSLLDAKVGGLLISFANPRHAHEISVLKQFPLASDQYLVAGVIDTLTNFVEHPEVVADRIERAAECVGDPSRVLAGTDCGFDTAAGMGRVTSDVVWAKLQSLREGAELASRRLF